GLLVEGSEGRDGRRDGNAVDDSEHPHEGRNVLSDGGAVPVRCALILEVDQDTGTTPAKGVAPKDDAAIGRGQFRPGGIYQAELAIRGAVVKHAERQVEVRVRLGE